MRRFKIQTSDMGPPSNTQHPLPPSLAGPLQGLWKTEKVGAVFANTLRGLVL